MQITWEYLKALAANNNKMWFEESKQWYEEARAEFSDLVQNLIDGISVWDPSFKGVEAKSCLFRIYKDARFNTSGEPYKINFGAHISSGGKKGDQGAYYLHIQPDKNFVGGGVYKPQAQVLKAVRTKIYDDPTRFKKIITASDFKNHFDGLLGEQLKTAPKGFDKSFPDIELLNFKQYVVMSSFDDAQVLDKNFKALVLSKYRAQKDLIKFINEAIDENA